jgi:hypothetical protein
MRAGGSVELKVGLDAEAGSGGSGEDERCCRSVLHGDTDRLVERDVVGVDSPRRVAGHDFADLRMNMVRRHETGVDRASKLNGPDSGAANTASRDSTTSTASRITSASTSPALLR